MSLQKIKEGINVERLYNIKHNKPNYMNGKVMVIKAIANKENGRVIGGQIIGYERVDKRIDVFATAISLVLCQKIYFILIQRMNHLIQQRKIQYITQEFYRHMKLNR
ncbi:hypothetical protein [Aerococcus viridans]|uniref:hypothetical protein n=1 Tax=Aerococcus viridans TaxID=1377 RepID=UPI003B20BFE2